MYKLSEKTKFTIKKVAFLSSLFLAVFLLAFYIINFDFGSGKRMTSEEKLIRESVISKEIEDRVGSDEVGISSFSDWAKVHGLKNISEATYEEDADGDRLLNYQEFIHLTDPLNPDTDGDGYSDMDEILAGYDPDDDGSHRLMVEIEIDKIGVQAPMVWSETTIEDEMQKDLEKGLAHFAGTAAPRQNGNMIVSGHSSNYFWAKGDYNYIFKDLNELVPGDVVTVKTIQKNGRTISYDYKIKDKFIAWPDDPRIFASPEKPVLTLSTCWPLGTTLKRVIVKAELVS